MELDDYHCQLCGSRSNLTVHHIKYRSQGGNDELENLITVCIRCHDKLHDEVWSLSFDGDRLCVSGRDGKVWHNDQPRLKADLAVNLHNVLTKLIGLTHHTFWEMGKVLKEIRENKTYETLDYESFADYLSSPEININYDSATKLIRVRTRMQKEIDKGTITKQDILDIGIEKSDRISRYVGRDNFIDWIHTAKSLSQRELKMELREAKKGKPKELSESFEQNKPMAINKTERVTDYDCSDNKNKRIVSESLSLVQRLNRCIYIYQSTKNLNAFRDNLSKVVRDFNIC